MTHAPAEPMRESRTISIVLVGNPNTGKTTLFNALTGLRHRVGNYAGVTVETKTGRAKIDGRDFLVTDVPGTYSLSPRSPDEMLAVDVLLGHRPEHGRPDAIVCILDASNLERNCYLASQVLELGIPVVFALNMIDVAEERGIRIDADKLSANLGVPVVLIQATKKRGINDLKQRVLSVVGTSAPAKRPVFPEPFLREVDSLKTWLAERGQSSTETFLLERALLDAGGQTETVLVQRVGSSLVDQLSAARTRLKEAKHPVPVVEVRTRYAWIAEQLAGAVDKPKVRKETFSDRVDRILLHRYYGMAAFLILMAVIFQAIYKGSKPFMDGIEAGFGWLAAVVSAQMPEGAVRDLIVGGAINGAGSVIVFLPQIIILFGFVAILEDCGYMARAAYLMDKVMSKCGLSGKSFIPMLSSFACAIPGIMAARTIEDRKDRLATILVAPLMSCSARLPVYILMTEALFPDTHYLKFISLKALIVTAMYLIGIVAAPLVAWTLKRSLLRGDTPVFLMELPSYKMPSIRAVFFRMIDRGWAFLKQAGTLILATSVIVWALLYYPRPTRELAAPFESRLIAIEAKKSAPGANTEALKEEAAQVEHEQQSAYQTQSFLGRMGHWIEPAVKPLGWDWRIGMATIASFPAREVIIATLGTIYRLGEDVDEESKPLHEALQTAKWPDGRPVFTIPVALSIMVFFALCCQCAATLAVIKRETNSWGWPAFTFVYMTSFAYVAAFVTFQIASRWM